MFLPYNVDVPMERLPIANWLLIGVTCVVSLTVLSSDWSDQVGQFHEIQRLIQTVENPKAKKEDVRKAEERIRQLLANLKPPAPPLAINPADFSPFQLATSLFVHGNLEHLVGNMLFLFVFGNAVNAKLGHPLFLGLYLLFGVLGGLAQLPFLEGRPCLGASGAIMGITGVFLVFFPRNDVVIWYLWYGGGGSFRISSIWLILLYLGLDLVGSLRGAGGGIGYMAHLGGWAAGIAAGIVLVRSGWFSPARGEQNLLGLLGLTGQPGRSRTGRRLSR